MVTTIKRNRLNYTLMPSATPIVDNASIRVNLPMPTNNSQNAPSLRGRSLFQFKRSAIYPDMVEVESFQKTFTQVLLQKVAKPGEAPFLTSGATAAEDEVADISMFGRTAEEFIPFFINALADIPVSVPTQAIGVTTGENIFQGAWAAVKSFMRFKKAMKINDRGGMLEAGIDGARGVTQSIGGAAYLGYRGTMIASQIYNVDTSSMHAATPLGQSAYTLGFVGNVMFGIFYLLIGVWAGYSTIKDWQFSLGMSAYEKDDSKLFDFLVRKVHVNPQAKLQKLKKHWNTLPEGKKLAQMQMFKKGSPILRFLNSPVSI